MNLNLVMSPWRCSDFATNVYFANTPDLINLNYSSPEQENIVVDLLFKEQIVRNKGFELYTADQLDIPRQLISLNNPYDAMFVWAFLDLNDFLSFTQLPEWINFMEAANKMNAVLGWTSQGPFKYTVVTTTWDPQTMLFSNRPTTFEEALTLYNNGTTLENI